MIECLLENLIINLDFNLNSLLKLVNNWDWCELIKEGILKGAKRKDPGWNKVKFGEPFKKALDRFREEVLGRDDFDPTSLLQFGLFMSMAVINILKEAEKNFGIDCQ